MRDFVLEHFAFLVSLATINQVFIITSTILHCMIRFNELVAYELSPGDLPCCLEGIMW
jgi:hypothetical protein